MRSTALLALAATVTRTWTSSLAFAMLESAWDRFPSFSRNVSAAAGGTAYRPLAIRLVMLLRVDPRHVELVHTYAAHEEVLRATHAGTDSFGWSRLTDELVAHQPLLDDEVMLEHNNAATAVAKRASGGAHSRVGVHDFDVDLHLLDFVAFEICGTPRCYA